MPKQKEFWKNCAHTSSVFFNHILGLDNKFYLTPNTMKITRLTYISYIELLLGKYFKWNIMTYDKIQILIQGLSCGKFDQQLNTILLKVNLLYFWIDCAAFLF